MSWRKVLRMGLVILALAGICAVGGVSSGVEEVGTVLVWEGILQGDPYADEGITRSVSAVLPPPELVAPLPIPEWHPPIRVTQPEDRVVVYDVISKKERVIDLPVEDGPAAQFVEGGYGARSDEDLGETVTPRNFGSLSLISNPENYPWCVNVKLFMRWGSSWWVGSGVLIDSLHVLTAGHCVHEGSGGSWADEIIVMPAYEDGWAPYGTSKAVTLYSWTGWTVDGNFDHDMGLIKLDRPVGALTGWHGYGYNTACSFYTDPSRTWYNPGYPAESPYTGEYMYWWYGYFDDCETYGAWFNNRSYGGQSGSGAYYIDGGNRYVHLVLSAGTISEPWWTWDVRMTPTKFGHIRDDWIGGNTPGTFDLIPLDVQVSPGTINCGSQLSSMSYVVHNYSSASWSGTVRVKVYLSTNDNISTADTLIQIHYFSHDFGPKSSVRVNVTTPPTIPSGLSSGTYWIGVILDISDSNTGNNDSDGQDAAQIAVSCETKPWTVAVYLAADNNLGGGTPSDPDFMDFDEIEKALTTSGSAVNVVVLWDKPGTNDTAIYWVQPDATEGTLATYTLDLNKWYIPPGWEFDYSTGWPKGASSPSEENMGDQATLTNFLNFVFYNFQSDYYALILWNHGGGWEPKSKEPPTQVEFPLESGETWQRTFWPPTQPLKNKEPTDRVLKPDPITRGVCWDDTDNDYLTTKEVAGGIANSSRGSVHNLGFDACLMQMLEVAYEVRNVAQYMTASQETEWGYGWAYHLIIAGITSTTTPLELAQLWGTSRARWMQDGLDTISSLDLTKVGTLAADVNALGNQLNALLGTNARYQEIMHAKLLSLCFARNEFLDLDDFCYWIKAFVNDATAKSLAQTVRDDIANTVVAKANGAGYGWAGGISVYMPHYHDIWWGAPHANYSATNFAFCADYAWDEFLNNWLATDYPDPYESNNTPATAYNLGVYSPPCLVLYWEADFDDSTPDWYKFTVYASPVNLLIVAWCTEYNSDTVIYLYNSQANAEAGNYFAEDDDGLYWQLGRNQLGSCLYLEGLTAGTYYLKVISYGETYGVDQDYELWIGTMYTPTAATFRVERETGAVLTDGAFYGQAFESGSADVAEWVLVSENVEPGDVLEIDPARPGYYRLARGPCSMLVAGVVSTSPGFVLGSPTPDSGLPTPDHALVALLGIVPVKVTDEGGPIQPGDLLVAATTPGYAMRWNPELGFLCGFVGKALEPLTNGKGVINVLLMTH